MSDTSTGQQGGPRVVDIPALPAAASKPVSQSLPATQPSVAISAPPEHAIVDSLPSQIAVVNPNGVIKKVNRAWLIFAESNGAVISRVCEGSDYLGVCDRAEGPGSDGAAEFAQALRDVLAGRRSEFQMEYPCHSPRQERWYIGRITRLQTGTADWAVVTHLDITDRKHAEAALRSSEERYRTVVEDQTEVICRFRPDGAFVFVNDVYCRFFGKTKAELLGKAWMPRAHPDDREMIRARLAVLSPSNPVVVIENRVFSGTGEVRWMQFVNRGIFDRDGVLAEVQAVGRDITDRKRAEEALRQSEAKYRSLHESMMDAFASADPDGRIREFNHVYREMLGYSEEELLRMSYQDLTPERWHDFEARIIQEQVLKRGFSDVYEKEYRRKDGTVFPVELRAFLTRDEGGKLARMWAIVRDITGRKKAEDALRESEKRFRAIFEQAPHGVALIDALSGRFLQVNRRYADIVGRTCEDMLGLDFQSITHPDDLERNLDNIQRLLQGESQWFSMEKRYIRPDSSLVWANLTVVPRWGEGQSTRYLIAMVEDITNRKTSELERTRLEAQLRQAQKLEALGRLSANVAHDFNNLLAVIHNNAARASKILGEQSDVWPVLEGIHQATEQAGALTRSLLTFGRGLKTEKKRLPLSEAVQGAFNLLQHVLPKSIRLETHLSPEYHGSVFCDPAQIHHVLLNLAVNARDAMPEGGTLRIEVRRAADAPSADEAGASQLPAAGAEIVVSDTGCGMPSEMLPKVFEPFFTTKPREMGSGLGLSIVHGIVRDLGGSIRVRSEVGVGSTFTIVLPCDDNEGVSGQPAAQSKRHETVAIIVRDAYLRGMIATVLKTSGYSVVFTTDREYDALVEEGPDKIPVMVLDVTGVEYDAPARCRELRARHPHLLIVLIAASRKPPADLADSQIVVLGQPFKISAVTSAVTDLIERHLDEE